MKFQSINKISGRLLDLPGVNGQERSKERLIESLQIGAKEMLETEVPYESGATMVTVRIDPPSWVESTGP